MRNVGFKSSKSTQKKRNLKAKFEELDIARRNVARNSSRETLLREEEEERKRLSYPIGLENIQEASPPGQPIRLQIMNTPEIPLTNPPTEMISDDEASKIILLKALKPLVTINLKNRQEKSAQESTNIKQDMPRKDEVNMEKEQKVCQTPIYLDTGDKSLDQRATLYLFS